MQRVLVTGGAGYIGSELVRRLLADGHQVRVVDNLSFGGEAILELLDHHRFEFIKADVRDDNAMRDAVRDITAVAHLAAIVGDPACAKDPSTARAINVDATRSLYEQCEREGVPCFVFASTCSNYGKMTDPDSLVDEESELRPVSVYAETKVGVEQFLLSQRRSNRCVPTCLRFATVYGNSPRMRFDLTVNEFTKDLAMGRELVVFGEQFWRPYCHVRDLSRAVALVIATAPEEVAFNVFNVGDTTENYQKAMLVELLRQEIPEAKVRFVAKDEDPRDYRVSFQKIHDKLGFRITRRVIDGIREINHVVSQGFLTDPESPKYYNVTPETSRAA